MRSANTQYEIDKAHLLMMQQAAIKAGAQIMQFYTEGFDVHVKDDQSPVTEADQAAERIILQALRDSTPDIAIVAEEEISLGKIPGELGGQFYLVDPLDGTKEFINRNGDFTVNIALIAAGEPVAGVVFAPVSGLLYTGSTHGAWQNHVQSLNLGADQPLQVRSRAAAPVAVVSRSHNSALTDQYLREHAIDCHQSVGSSLKFCLLASGQADIYPRFSRTMEWDTAAGDAVLRAAGGSTLDMNGELLTYGKRNQSNDCDFANPYFIAHGGKYND